MTHTPDSRLPAVFTVSVERTARYLVLVAGGQAELGDLAGLADLAARVASMENRSRVLVDLLAVTHKLTFTDHLALGSHVARVFGNLERVATVVPVALRTGTSEKAAQKLGATLRTFTDRAEAAAWVSAD